MAVDPNDRLEVVLEDAMGNLKPLVEILELSTHCTECTGLILDPVYWTFCPYCGGKECWQRP